MSGTNGNNAPHKGLCAAHVVAMCLSKLGYAPGMRHGTEVGRRTPALSRRPSSSFRRAGCGGATSPGAHMWATRCCPYQGSSISATRICPTPIQLVSCMPAVAGRVHELSNVAPRHVRFLRLQPHRAGVFQHRARRWRKRCRICGCHAVAGSRRRACGAVGSPVAVPVHTNIAASCSRSG